MLWWTFQNLVIASVLAALVWLACRSGRIGPVGRHALWLVVLIKLLTPPLVVWPWAVHDPIGLTKPPGRAEPPHAVAHVAAAVHRLAIPPAPAPALTSVEADDGFDLGPSEDSQDFTTPEPSVADSTTSVSDDPASLTANVIPAPPHSRWLQAVVPILGGVWLAGGMAFAALQCVRIARLLVRLRHAAPAPPDLAEQVDELSARLGIRSVRTRLIAGMQSPAILGLHRPVLLWPAELPADLPAHSVRGLIVHELAHVKRRDHWVGWLELLAGCLWWWNPLFWYVRHQVRENAELACDGWVVSTLPRGGRRAYAEGLLAICEFISRRNAPMPAVGVNTGGRRFLERRLAMILRENVPLRLPRVGLLSVALLALMTLPAWSQQQRESESPRDETDQSTGKVDQRLQDESVRSSAPRPAPYGDRTTAADDRSSPESGHVVVVRSTLPDDAQNLIKQFQQSQAEVRRKYEAALQEQRDTLLKELHRLHDLYAAQGRQDAAAAIEGRIRGLEGADTFSGIRTTTVRPPQPAAPNRFRVSADPGNLVEYRDRVGRSFVFDVTGKTDGPVWGDDVYTDDSALATAAVHAGVLRDGQRGRVRVTILPGRDSYSGSARHGVTSSDYSPWDGSYRVQPADAPLAGAADLGVDLSANLGVRSRTGAAAALPGRVVDGVRPDPGNLIALRGQAGRMYTFDVTGSDQGPVWGSGIYTDDSSLAAAAVHAGLLRVGQRGQVTIVLLPGRDSYAGSTRHGVTSEPYGPWEGSFRFGPTGRPGPRAGYNPRLPQPQPPVLREPVNLESMRDQVGKEFDVQIVGSSDGSVWGGDNGVYTDDSSLAAAAVHAGLLTNGRRGVVRVRILPGQDHYAGSNRNGVTSESWESWGGSFQLEGVRGGGVSDRKAEEQGETLKDKTVREELRDLSRSVGF